MYICGCGFAGLFVAEDKYDPVWISKLQSKNVLSILDTEYIALSQGMRELVSSRGLILELSERMNLDLKGASVISKAWEDNIGAQNLANTKGHLMNACIKHIGIKNIGLGPRLSLTKLKS